jgi:hypothetical protein
MEMAVQERKKKKLAFDAEQVFKPEPAVDVTLDLESSRYKAQHGEGGDRRADK